jgi:aryl-alcohol dehydrogenase-like predicted oxidoreductase
MKRLGQTDIHLSPIGLGTVKFGRNQGVKYPAAFDLPDMAHLKNLLSVAKELGVNHLDTAPSYGLSEERLGVLLEGQRKDWVIVGKVGEEFENGTSAYIFTPEHFKKSLERSLKRLKTDYLDILLIHSDGADTDILSQDALIETMMDFKKRGIVRAIGASTKTVEGGYMALDQMDCAMVAYNPGYETERPVLDRALEFNKGILIKKALGSGHIDQFGGADPVKTALDFIFQHPAVTSVITGTINPDNLAHNVRSCSMA